MASGQGEIPTDIRAFVEEIRATLEPRFSVKAPATLQPLLLPPEVSMGVAAMGRVYSNPPGGTNEVIGVLNPVWHPEWQNTRDFDPVELVKEALSHCRGESGRAGAPVLHMLEVDGFVELAGGSPGRFLDALRMFENAVLMTLHPWLPPDYGDPGDETAPILLTSRLWSVGESTGELPRVILDPGRLAAVAADDRMIYYAKLAAWLSSVSLLPLLAGQIAANDEAAARAIEAMLALLAFLWAVRPPRPG
jgi:hypothetical protein